MNQQSNTASATRATTASIYSTVRIQISRLTKPAPPSCHRKRTHPPPANNCIPPLRWMLILPPSFGRLKSTRFIHHRHIVGHQRIGGRYVIMDGRTIVSTFVSRGGGLVECEGGDYFHRCYSGLEGERSIYWGRLWCEEVRLDLCLSPSVYRHGGKVARRDSWRTILMTMIRCLRSKQARKRRRATVVWDFDVTWSRNSGN